MNTITLRFDQIIVPPGHEVWLQDINWKTFETILNKLDETRGRRLAYNGKILEIMSPLAWHEDSKNIISRFIEVLLEEMSLEFRALGSTTFKNPRTGKAVEPDECYYIENEAMIRGKLRINLLNDPPPDLVLEIDLSSNTHLNIYQALGVPEVWRYAEDKLFMYVLQKKRYVKIATSPHFPAMDLCTAIPQFLIQSRIQGRTTATKGFRVWVKENLQSANIGENHANETSV